MTGGQNTLERFVAWTATDVAEFEVRLRQLWPHLRIFANVRAEPPLRRREREHGSLSEVTDTLATIVFAPSGWEPTSAVTGDTEYLTEIPLPYLILRDLTGPGVLLDTGARRSFVHSAHLWFVYDKSAESQARLVRAGARAVDKGGSRHMFDRDPDTLEIHPCRSGPFQIGHDMARYCMRHPGSVIGGRWGPISAIDANDADLLPETRTLDSWIFLLHEDEEILSRKLREAFPGVVFADGPLWWQAEPADLRTSQTIGASPERVVSVLLPEPGWQPRFALGRSGRWRLVNRPYPTITIRRSNIVADPIEGRSPAATRLTMGFFLCHYLHGDRASRAGAETVMSVLRDIAAPRRSEPGLFGHAAARWAEAAPGRSLTAMTMSGTGVLTFVRP